MKVPDALAWLRHWHDPGAFAHLSSEEVLARYAQNRDEAAFRELLHRHGGHVWAVCRRTLSQPDRAEDAFQTTFLELVKQADRVGKAGSLAGWLDKTARRTAAATKRKQAKRSAAESAADPPRDSLPSAEAREASAVVRAAVLDLPERYRLPIVYRYLAGLTPPELAKTLDLPEETGKTRLKRGLELLRQKLAKRGLAVGAGAVSVEAAVSAAGERIPLGLSATTVKVAVQSPPIRRGLFAAATAFLTTRHGVVTGLLLAGGVVVALAPAGPKNGSAVSTQTLRPEKETTMRGSPLLALAAALGINATAPAQTYTKIADVSTPIPNGSGNFSGFGGLSVSGTTVVMEGSNPTSTMPATQRGIYSAPVGGGPLTRLADANTPIPNGTGTFGTAIQTLSDISTSGHIVVFYGRDDNGAQRGIYSVPISGGPVTRIVDRTTNSPTGGFLDWFEQPKISGSTVLFRALSVSTDTRGLYTVSSGGGTVSEVNTTIFGGPPSAGNWSLSGTTIVINPTSGGVFATTTNGASWTVLANQNTPIPGGSGNFASIRALDINGSYVAMAGRDSSDNTSLQTGVYVGSATGGPLTKIADKNTPVPGRTGNFTRFTFAYISGSSVVFGSGNNPTGGTPTNGIYLSSVEGGPITKIAAVGDVFDGKTVAGIGSIGKFDGMTLAFSLTFTDSPDSPTVYTFTPVPEPPAVLAVSSIAGAAFVVVLRRWAGGV